MCLAVPGRIVEITDTADIAFRVGKVDFGGIRKEINLAYTPEAEVGVSFAPNGKRVAFLRAGKLVTMDPDGKNEKIVAGDGQIFDYEWSPDSQWKYSQLRT